MVDIRRAWCYTAHLPTSLTTTYVDKLWPDTSANDVINYQLSNMLINIHRYTLCLYIA